MLSLIQLQTFVLCAEHGSFSAAARKLGKAQSVVSQAIANLEIDLDQVLFDRSSRSPKLTEAGVRLLAHAKAVLAQTQEMEQTARSLSLGAESEIVLSVDNALLTQTLFNVLSEFRASFKATQLEVLVLENGKIANQVKTGKAHIGLMLLDPALIIGVEQGFIGKIDFITVVHPSHPLTLLSRASRGDLSRYPQIVLTNNKDTQSEHIPLISPERISCNDFGTMAQLAAASLGWVSLPAHIAEPLIEQGLLAKLDVLLDTKTWQISVDRITQMGSPKGPALTWLIKASEQLFD